MDDPANTIGSIDDYIAALPPETANRLSRLRDALREAVPDAAERMSYNMPTLWFEGNLVHFAAYKDHIGLYPTPSGIERFAEELAPYATSKGAIRFPHDQPLPLELIVRIARYRLEENAARAAARREKKRK